MAKPSLIQLPALRVIVSAVVELGLAKVSTRLGTVLPWWSSTVTVAAAVTSSCRWAWLP